MSPTLLFVDFAFPGPWGEALATACAGLAADIAGEPGLRWKLWTEDPEAGRAGGVYLFDARLHAERYLEKHRARLQGFGVERIDARLMQVGEALSAVTRGPLEAPAAAGPSFTTLARVRIADAGRFVDVFSTRGRQARRQHGSRGAQAFLSADEPGQALVLIDWRDRQAFESFRSDAEVRETMRSGGALEPPAFTVLERLGRFDA